MNSLGYGLIAGLLGSAAWAGFASLTGLESGWIAIMVGVLVGVGVGLGNKSGQRRDMSAGLLAMGIATLSILFGKVAVAELSVPSDLEVLSLAREQAETDEFMIAVVATTVAAEMEAEGRQLTWPTAQNSRGAVRRTDFPSLVWREAARRWAATSPPEKIALRSQVRFEREVWLGEHPSEARSSARRAAYNRVFAASDVLFVLAAMAAAFKIAADSRPSSTEPVQEAS